MYPPNSYLKTLGLTGTPTETVLDLGCGPGYYTIPLAKQISGKVVAFDVRSKMLTAVEERSKRKDINNIFTIQGRSENLPFHDQSFDVIMICLVLGEIVKMQKTVDELLHVLKDSGKISILENVFDDHYLTPQEIKNIFSDNDWSIKIITQEKTFYVLEIRKRCHQ